MSLKKVALFILACFVVYGFSVSSVKASAHSYNEGKESTTKESPKPEASVLPTVAASVTAEPEATTAPVKLQEPVAVPAIVATAAPSTVNNSTKAPTTVKKVSKQKKAKKATKKKVSKKKKEKKKAAYSKADLRLMASIINCEAGAECYQGKLAVGIVVMNRIKSKAFPNTLKGVIYQKYQFSPVRNGSLHKRLSQYDRGQTGSAQWKSCISAAKKTLSGQNTIVMKGKIKNMKGVHFFSVGLAHAKFKLGGHRFK